MYKIELLYLLLCDTYSFLFAYKPFHYQEHRNILGLWRFLSKSDIMMSSCSLVGIYKWAKITHL